MSKGQSALNHLTHVDRLPVSTRLVYPDSYLFNGLNHTWPSDGRVGYFDASQYKILSDPYLVSFIYVCVSRKYCTLGGYILALA
jgi:hypothetical protein